MPLFTGFSSYTPLIYFLYYSGKKFYEVRGLSMSEAFWNGFLLAFGCKRQYRISEEVEQILHKSDGDALKDDWEAVRSYLGEVIEWR